MTKRIEPVRRDRGPPQDLLHALDVDKDARGNAKAVRPYAPGWSIATSASSTPTRAPVPRLTTPMAPTGPPQHVGPGIPA